MVLVAGACPLKLVNARRHVSFSGATGDSVHLAIQVILSHEIQLIQPDICLAVQEANLSDDTGAQLSFLLFL